MLPIIFILISSFLITYFLTPVVITFAKKWGLVDNPKVRIHPAHTHKGIIPRAGGLAIFIGIFIPAFIFIGINIILLGILAGSLILVLVGVWDDKKDRSPYIRFFTNCLAAVIVILAGVSIPYITNPLGGVLNIKDLVYSFNFWGLDFSVIVTFILAFIWIIWTTNIVGWSGGVDGQLPGFVSISAIVIGLLSLRFASHDLQQVQVTYLSFATAGAFLGFLPWNFYPQKIMPGYGGKTLAGFMLGILSILSFSKLGTALLVLAIPITDAIFILIKRVLSGKSPMSATSGHLHHHLLSLGWSKKKIAIFYWLISAVLGIIALSLNSKQKIFAGVLVAVVLVGFIIWINFLKKFPKQIPED